MLSPLQSNASDKADRRLDFCESTRSSITSAGRTPRVPESLHVAAKNGGHADEPGLYTAAEKRELVNQNNVVIKCGEKTFHAGGCAPGR